MWTMLVFGCSMAGKWGADTGEDAPRPAEEADVDTDTDADTDALAPGDLVITEIMKNPDAVEDDLGEWFEVTSLSSDPVSLAGLEIRDDDGDGFTLNGTTLAAGARLVFGASADLLENGGVPVDVAYDVEDFKLGNDGGAVTLVYAGEVLDTVVYDAAFPDEKGRSLSLSPDASTPDGNDVAGAWCSAAATYGLGDHGTPGAANDACGTDTVPTDTDADDDGFDDADDCGPDDPDVFPGATEVEDGVDDDCDGYVDERSPTLADLVITEIMKDPAPTDDETGEWFEIVNGSGVPIALDGLTVTDAGGTGFTVVTDAILDPAALYVLAVSGDEDANGGLTPDYVYSVTDLRLSNGDDELLLSYGGVLVDAVAYDGDFPDDSGKSLSLDPAAWSAARNDDAGAWCEGDGEYGTDGDEGTPGAVNPPCE